jgi:type II secretory pathway pseudopilin PulG
MLKLLKNQQGDTIVEVMIVLALIGSALGISYATANQSLLDTRQAQEASQAAQLIQSQVEELRTMTDNPATLNGNPNPNYIFNSTATPFCITQPPSGSFNVSLDSDPTEPCNIPFSNYSGTTSNLYYSISINYIPTTVQTSAVPPAPITGGTFTIQARWPDVEGEGTDTSTLIYNLYQP